MKKYNFFCLIIFALLIFLFNKVSSQTENFDIRGKLEGRHFGKIYLFFDNEYARKDSISSSIENGNFHFYGVAALPILARLHLGQNSYILDIYLDSPNLTIGCTNTIELSNSGKDTLNKLKILWVKGSQMEKEKMNFEKSISKIKGLGISKEDKQELIFKKLSAFVGANSKSKLSAYLTGNAESLSFKQIYELSTRIDTSLKHTYEGKIVNRLLSSLDKSRFWKPGTLFYDVNLPDINGNLLSTREIRKKFTLYIFWASWCRPCREENPDLRSFYSLNKNKGVEIVSISLDNERSRWLDAIKKDSLPWTQLSDLSGFQTEICQHYGIETIPASFFVDKGGRIIGVNMPISDMEAIIDKESIQN